MRHWRKCFIGMCRSGSGGQQDNKRERITRYRNLDIWESNIEIQNSCTIYSLRLYIFIYIERERQRERERIYIYIYRQREKRKNIYIYIYSGERENKGFYTELCVVVSSFRGSKRTVDGNVWSTATLIFLFNSTVSESLLVLFTKYFSSVWVQLPVLCSTTCTQQYSVWKLVGIIYEVL